MTNATYTQPASVDTYVKSATHNLFGANGQKSRFTRSCALVAAGSGVVVRLTFPRRAPCRPRVFINRSTVQRATPMPASGSHSPGAAPDSPNDASAFPRIPHSSSPAECPRPPPPFSPSCGRSAQTRSQVSTPPTQWPPTPKHAPTEPPPPSEQHGPAAPSGSSQIFST